MFTLEETTNYTISFRAMGCHIQGWVNVASEHDAQILQMLPVWFEAWEQVFSRFRPESELSTLNRDAGQWVKMSETLMQVIMAAIKGASETKGLFNPLILPALKQAGYDHSFDPDHFVPGKRSTNRLFIADVDGIDIDTDRGLVRIPAESQLDLGGIAKGWSAQEAAKRLAEIGPCMVDAGGDMVAIGSPDDTGGWLATVANPITDEESFTMLLRNAAVATSGRDYRQWVRDGKPMHHIIDPRTGVPSTGNVLTATVIAPDAAQAEVWAKYALIDGNLTNFPTLLFYNDGTSLWNKEFEELCISSED